MEKSLLILVNLTLKNLVMGPLDSNAIKVPFSFLPPRKLNSPNPPQLKISNILHTMPEPTMEASK